MNFCCFVDCLLLHLKLLLRIELNELNLITTGFEPGIFFLPTTLLIQSCHLLELQGGVTLDPIY